MYRGFSLMLQDRDYNILNFISVYELCTNKHLEKIFFKGTTRNVAPRRLKTLTEKYELLNRAKIDGNMFIYYKDKKPSKRLLAHDLQITNLVVEMILNDFEILEFKKSFVVGNVISDCYIRYKNKNGDTKHFVLEVQLSNTIADCVNKYKGYRDKLIDNKVRIGTVPSLLVLTNLPNKVYLKDMKVKYLNLDFKDIVGVL